MYVHLYFQAKEELLRQEEAEQLAAKERADREMRVLEKERRKLEKHQKKQRRRGATTTTFVRPPTQEVMKQDLVRKFLDSSVPFEKQQSINATISKKSAMTPAKKWEPLETAGPSKDWYADLPPIDPTAIGAVSEQQQSSTSDRDDAATKPQASSWRKPYITSYHGRTVIGLPYVDLGIPDFIERNVPNKCSYYAEENFMYGRPRPESDLHTDLNDHV